MSQSNLSRFYQKRKKRNSEILSGIISGRSKYAKTKKNSSEAPRFETLEPIVVVEKRAESPPRFERIESRAASPAATTPRYERIESWAESPAATSPVTAAAAEITSKPANKRRRTEAGSVGQHSDGNSRKNVK